MVLLSTLLYCLVLGAILLVAEHVAVYVWDPKRLRKYPGLNRLCGITNLAYIFGIWRGDAFRTRELAQAHRKHNVIRLGPSALSFGRIEAIHDIYGHSTACLKGDMYSTAAGPHRSLLDSVDRKEHGEKRKRLAAAFATKHLEAWEHKVVDKCSRLMAQFDRHCAVKGPGPTGEVVDFRKWSNLFTVEAIADISLSEQLGLIEAGDDTVVARDDKGRTRSVAFVRSLHGVGRMAAPIVWSSRGYPFLKRILSLVSKAYGSEVSNNSTYDSIVRQMVWKRDQRQASGEKLDDLYACLVEDRRGQPTGLEMEEIAAEVGVFSKFCSHTRHMAGLGG
jgi:benzoate 4-monooxygenase